MNLYLMDMSNAQNTSGVDRYINTLIKGLENYTDIQVHWIQLLHDDSRLLHSEEHVANYVKFTIPMPQQSNEIISERFWMRKYNEHVYALTQHLFAGKENCIIHLHTLNLIDLALYVKEQNGSKIITHLHCIPWKGFYNGNIRKFNQLYDDYYLKKIVPTATNDAFTSNNCELQSYNDADYLVCVTQCAKDFLRYRMKKHATSLTIIPNGINDMSTMHTLRPSKKSDQPFRCIYAGVVSESKGVKYILKALQLVQDKGYSVALDVAGAFAPQLDIKLKNEFPSLEFTMLGRIPFADLIQLYEKNDIGVIASLQEQASFVAVEMAMFGLPVVSTAVDGLDELFTDGVNALKVNTKFSKVFGLSVDVVMMAEKIIMLIENQELRNTLSVNARKLYETELKLELMMERTVEVYKRVKAN